MTLPALRPLPGFAFEAAAPVHDEVLPRMDVAVFAGFAARGPVGVPVPVEDVGQFTAIYGGDTPLALDTELGRPLTAGLAPAVRLFFANGGTRCWIIRLARDARPSMMSVPGVAVLSGARVAPLALPATSPGSWSDDMTLAASLTSQRLGLVSWNRAEGELVLSAPVDAALARGDLLRIGARGAGTVLHAAIARVAPDDAGTTTRRRPRVVVTLGALQWADAERTPASRTGRTRLGEREVDVAFGSSARDLHGFTGDVALTLYTSAARAPRPGELLVVRFGAETLLVTVRRVDVSAPASSPAAESVDVRGEGVWLRASAPAALPALETISVERLSLELWARAAGGTVHRLGDLGLGPDHPRHVGLIPDDARRYRSRADLIADGWSDVGAFPAAGGGAAGLCIPVGVGGLPDVFLPATIPAGAELERDGLVPFDLGLFGDPSLIGSRTATLLEDAEFVRTLGPVTRELTGLHRALEIDEATLLAVPDAVNPGWLTLGTEEPPPPDASEADSDAQDYATFMDCGVVPGRPPVLQQRGDGSDGTVTLEWTAAAGTSEFQLEESTRRDWGGAVEVFRGTGSSASVSARRPGDYYYRVRGVGDHPTHWSEGVGVRVAGARGWRVRREDERSDDVVLAVHRMMLRLCAARRDIMTVLSLPAHYHEDAAIAHVRRLGEADTVTTAAADTVPRLGFGESDALGFGALYHGWLATPADDGTLQSAAPDGAACGFIARRTLARGAWIAPANEPLRGVVALANRAATSRLASLIQRGVNPIVHAPRGFTVMSADTLALDDEVRPINVRRLLILLRREATRRGATYVFEPHDDAFRRMVQRGFEAMLGSLYERGAFAGAMADAAFQVRTDSSLNTQASMDAGRFIVELRVAPARPLQFLTVRLVQTGDRVTLSGA